MRSFEKWPRITTAATTVVTAIGLIGAVLGIQQEQVKRQEKERKFADFSVQMKMLGETRESLQTLLAFVDGQEKKMAESRDLLNQLKEQEQQLTPIVQAKKEMVDALFAVQSQRQSSSLLYERWLGFGLGVLASLIASALWAFAVWQYKKRYAVHTVIVSDSTQPTDGP